MAGLVESVAQPVSALGLCAEYFAGKLFQSWLPALADGLAAGGFDFLHPFMPQSIRRCLVEIGFAHAQRDRADSDVDVLGESLDGMEYLRERRSALENAGVSQFGRAENPAQQPADPKILLDDHRAFADTAERTGCVRRVEGWRMCSCLIGGRDGAKVGMHPRWCMVQVGQQSFSVLR